MHDAQSIVARAAGADPATPYLDTIRGGMGPARPDRRRISLVDPLGHQATVGPAEVLALPWIDQLRPEDMGQIRTMLDRWALVDAGAGDAQA